MPSINDVFGGVYLKASDLKGTEPTVTIESVVPKKLQDGSKLDIAFVGKEKHLLANKTNSKRIAFMHGEDYEFWPGKRIKLYVDLVDFQGNTVEAIRVRPPAVKERQNGQAVTRLGDRITSGPELQRAADAEATRKQVIADEELQHDSDRDPNDEIPF